MKILLLHKEKQDPVDWERYHQLRVELDQLYYDPFNYAGASAAEWKKSFDTNLQADFILNGIIEKKNRYVGYFRYLTMPDGITNSFFFFIREEEMDEEVMQEVKTRIGWWMRLKNHSLMAWRSRQAFFLPYKEALGGKKSNTGCCFRLKIADINMSLVEEWIKTGEEQAKGFSIIEQDYLEEPYIEAVANLANQLVEDMPREDTTIQLRSTPADIRETLERSKLFGLLQNQILLFSPDKKLVGTTLIVLSHRDGEIDQRITGVDRSFRRKGLAKYLKALMLKKIMELYPNSPGVRTECFRMNVPMINLNLEMGYKLVAEDVDHLFTRENWG